MVRLTPQLLALNVVFGFIVFILRMSTRDSVMRPRVVQILTWLAILSWAVMVIVLWVSYDIIHPGFGNIVLLAAAGWVVFWSIPPVRGLGYSAGIAIRRTPEEVFDFFTDPSNWPRYTRTLMAQRLDSGPMKVGSIIRSTVFLNGQSLDAQEVVTDYERPSIFATQLRGVSEVLTERAAISTTEDGTNITVTFHTTGSLSAALAGARLNKWSLQRRMREDRQHDLERLKMLLEEEQAA